MFAICNLSNIPLRIEPNDRSEIVSQVLFGEHFSILEVDRQWSKIKLQYDDYEGWIDSKQYQSITEEQFNRLSNLPIELNSDLVEYISTPTNSLIPITIGANVTFLSDPDLNLNGLTFELSLIHI
jgi:uncharacterized protein YgiM (DUF1202 family)